MPQLTVMDGTGDTALAYCPTSTAELAGVQQRFDQLLAGGYAEQHFLAVARVWEMGWP